MKKGTALNGGKKPHRILHPHPLSLYLAKCSRRCVRARCHAIKPCHGSEHHGTIPSGTHVHMRRTEKSLTFIFRHWDKGQSLKIIRAFRMHRSNHHGLAPWWPPPMAAVVISAAVVQPHLSFHWAIASNVGVLRVASGTVLAYM